MYSNLFKETIKKLLKVATKYSYVEGIFLAGSLANKHADEYADIDICIIARDRKAYSKLWEKRMDFVNSVGNPISLNQRLWDKCSMIVALFSKKTLPPVGLDVDIVFGYLSQISHVMPWVPYRVIFDRSGKLKKHLKSRPSQIPSEEIKKRIIEELSWIPFAVYEAVKDLRRGDRYDFQGQLSRIRKLIFFLKGVEKKELILGTKRAINLMNTGEKRILDASYEAEDIEMVKKLLGMLFASAEKIGKEYKVEEEIRVKKKEIEEYSNFDLDC